MLWESVGLNVEKSIVEVVRNGETEKIEVIEYDELVIATRFQICSRLLFKPLGLYEKTLEA